MSFHPFAFDDNVTNTGGGSAHVPDGEYLLEIAALAISKEDEDSDYYRWTMRIDQGPAGIGQSLQYNCTCYTPKPSKAGGETAGQFALGRLVEAVGLNAATLKEYQPKTQAEFEAVGQGLLQGLKGKKVRALVANRAGENRNGQQMTYSNIIELGPATDFRLRAATGPAPDVAPGPSAPADPGLVDRITSMFPGVPAL